MSVVTLLKAAAIQDAKNAIQDDKEKADDEDDEYDTTSEKVFQRTTDETQKLIYVDGTLIDISRPIGYDSEVYIKSVIVNDVNGRDAMLQYNVKEDRMYFILDGLTYSADNELSLNGDLLNMRKEELSNLVASNIHNNTQIGENDWKLLSKQLNEAEWYGLTFM